MLRTRTSIVLILAFISMQFFFYGAKMSAKNVFADNDSILLTLENASFVPLSNVDGNQVTMSVKYQVNDESLEGEKVNGIMKLYSTNGSHGEEKGWYQRLQNYHQGPYNSKSDSKCYLY